MKNSSKTEKSNKITKTSQPKEVTVEQASKFLDCSARSILNYINKKEIDAIKVGKFWHINFISLQAFKKNYNFVVKESDLETSPPELSELTADQFYVEEEIISFDPSEEAPPVNKKKYRPLHSLRCYQITCHAFMLEGWQDQATMEDKRIQTLKMTVLENLGAGFYSYESAEKARYYNQARAALASIIALLSTSKPKRDKWSRELSVLESQVIPACSALIRKMEKQKKVL